MTSSPIRSTVLLGAGALLMTGLLLACSVQMSESSESPESPQASIAAQEEATNSGVTLAPDTQSLAAIRVAPVSVAAMSPEQRGQEIFAKQCTICHGEQGDGAGKFAYLMNPRPRNFKVGKFKLTTTQNLVPSDDDLFRTISRGMPGSAMPPWGHLPIADLNALVAYVKTIHEDAVKAELEAGIKDGTYSADEVAAILHDRTQPGDPIIVPPEPRGDDLRWFNGRRIYTEACASCHGPDGHPLPAAVKFDDEGFPDPPRSFVNGIFKGGMEGSDLYCRIIKGMRGTPMPAYDGVYSADDTWDLIHYVQSLARAGSQERAQLRQSTISAPKVAGALPSGPADPMWNQARAAYVGLTPLWWTDDRIEGLVVQGLHNNEELALRLSWLDTTRDDRAVRVDEFRDAVAIQFSLSSDPPFYMGDASEHGGVNIWMWKADRQKNIDRGYQDVDAAFPNRVVDMYDECPIRSKDMSSVDWPHGALAVHNALFITAWGAGNLVSDPNLKTPVECLVAKGPGTLAGKPANLQVVKGQAVYERGVWSVQMQRSLDLPHGHESTCAHDERLFRSGDYLPVSFAIWNGSTGDRDGKKDISIWQKLVIE